MPALLMIARKFAVTPFSPHNYTYVGDVIVNSITILMIVLLFQGYMHRTKHFRLLLGMLVASLVSASSNLCFQMLLESPHASITAIYLLRIARNTSLCIAMSFHLWYLQQPLWLPEDLKKRTRITTRIGIAVTILVDILGTVLHYGFYIDADDTVYCKINVFVTAFTVLTSVNFVMLIQFKSRLINPVFWGLIGSDVICLAILFVQVRHGDISYTNVAYIFPLLGLIFMFHSNPYDVDTGAVSEQFFFEELGDNLEKKKTMVLISCTMPNFFALMKSNKKLRYTYYEFFRQNVHKGVLYRLSDSQIVLAFEKSFDIKQDETIEKMIYDFKECYSIFNIDYQIVVMETTAEIEGSRDYARLIEYIESSMPMNTVYEVRERDVKAFYTNNYILNELENIVQNHDLDDERVKVYCQPVFNLSTNSYDTAEALMRLELERLGMVYPDQFISLAEQHGMIHTLSMIILNKTCTAIRSMMEDGYDINRISVNFSTMDLRYDSFCSEVQQIISRSQIPFDKIAIEITESRNEADFNIMKKKVKQLQKLGIKFYLDDFGTGYSNFERIMAIPFDIIKFDRSMLIESSRSESSFYMVSTFANMFDQLQYSVLFEGIEDTNDEENCVRMKAKYLQGYKYSRPIPIEKLCEFLSMPAGVTTESN